MERRGAQTRADQAKGFVADFAFGNVRIDSLDSKPQRKTNHNLLAAQGVILVALVTAACNADKTPATQTPTLPNETVPPSLVIPSATPEATPTSTPEPTATPEATLPTLKGMVETNPAKIDDLKTFVTKTTTDINTVLANNPSAIRPTGTTAEYYKTFWNDCQKASTDQGREFACEDFIGTMWYNYNNIAPKDQGFFNVIQEVYDYSGNTLSQKYFDILKQNLANL